MLNTCFQFSITSGWTYLSSYNIAYFSVFVLGLLWLALLQEAAQLFRLPGRNINSTIPGQLGGNRSGWCSDISRPWQHGITCKHPIQLHLHSDENLLVLKRIYQWYHSCKCQLRDRKYVEYVLKMLVEDFISYYGLHSLSLKLNAKLLMCSNVFIFRRNSLQTMMKN